MEFDNFCPSKLLPLGMIKKILRCFNGAANSSDANDSTEVKFFHDSILIPKFWERPKSWNKESFCLLCNMYM